MRNKILECFLSFFIQVIYRRYTHVMVRLFFVLMQSGRLLDSAHVSSVKKFHFASNFMLSQYVDRIDSLYFFLFFKHDIKLENQGRQFA